MTSPATWISSFPRQSLRRTITKGVGEGQAEFVDATRIATALLGDSIATNMFMLGYAFQTGLVPLSAEAINKAIELNGAAVKMNQAAFLWGRRTAVDVDCGRAARSRPRQRSRRAPELSHSLDEIVRRRVEFLTDYQNAAYADKYRALVEQRAPGGSGQGKGTDGLGEAVARYYFKLHGLQGRVRGRAAVCRARLPGQDQGAVRGRLQAALPSGAAAARQAQRKRRAAPKRSTAPGCSAPSGCWPNCAACAAPPSMCSATPKSAERSAS